MKLVRGTMVGLALCLAVAGPAAQAAAPDAAPRVAQSSARAGKDWQVLKSWKKGVVRGCRSTWDGDSFSVAFQLVNRAAKGQRGGLLGIRSDDFPDWQNYPAEPIASGKKQTFIDSESWERPRQIDVRAKVTRGDTKSSWGKVVRLDRLNVC